MAESASCRSLSVSEDRSGRKRRRRDKSVGLDCGSEVSLASSSPPTEEEVRQKRHVRDLISSGLQPSDIFSAKTQIEESLVAILKLARTSNIEGSEMKRIKDAVEEIQGGVLALTSSEMERALAENARLSKEVEELREQIQSVQKQTAPPAFDFEDLKRSIMEAAETIMDAKLADMTSRLPPILQEDRRCAAGEASASGPKPALKPTSAARKPQLAPKAKPAAAQSASASASASRTSRRKRQRQRATARKAALEMDMAVDPIWIKREQTDARVLELPKSVSQEAADRISEKVGAIYAGDVRLSQPIKCAELRVSNLDYSVTKEDLLEEIARQGQCSPSSVTVGDFRPSGGGKFTTIVKCPLTSAPLLVTKKQERFLVSWSAARVVLLEARPMKCHRCLELEHTGVLCTCPTNRGGPCYHCA